MSFTLSLSTLVQNKMTNSATLHSAQRFRVYKYNREHIRQKNAFYFFGVKSFLPEVIPDKEMCSYILFI